MPPLIRLPSHVGVAFGEAANILNRHEYDALGAIIVILAKARPSLTFIRPGVEGGVHGDHFIQNTGVGCRCLIRSSQGTKTHVQPALRPLRSTVPFLAATSGNVSSREPWSTYLVCMLGSGDPQRQTPDLMFSASIASREERLRRRDTMPASRVQEMANFRRRTNHSLTQTRNPIPLPLIVTVTRCLIIIGTRCWMHSSASSWIS
jgi:hypothetical protein